MLRNKHNCNRNDFSFKETPKRKDFYINSLYPTPYKVTTTYFFVIPRKAFEGFYFLP